MLFTNKSLEIIKTREGRKLELFSMYRKDITIPVAEGTNEKILFVQDSVTHKYLNFQVTENGLVFENTKSDSLYLVLDLLEYKFFKTNSKIEVASGLEVTFDKVDEHDLRNRLKTNWTISILEAIGNGFGALKLTTTSGRVSYLLVNNKSVTLTNFKGAVKFIEENKIDCNFTKIEWTRL